MKSNILRRNNVKISGSGEKTIMFAHGFGCDQNMWRFVTPAFADDYRVVLFDYVGAGGSDAAAYDANRYANLSGYAEDVLEICDALDLNDLIFVGHSVSSMIGVLAAIAQPERFSHLVQLVPSPCYINHPPDYEGGFDRADINGLLELMDKNYIGWANYLAPVIMKNSDRPELSAELEESFCAMDPDISRRFAEATFFADNRADLARVTTPSLILQVVDDAIAPVSVGNFISRAIPNSKLHLMDIAGHCPHISHPRETIKAIKDYLANF